MITHKNVLLITGCSSGFGYLTARLFATQGWQVYGTLRDIQTSAAKELRDNGVTPLQLDITDTGSVARAVSFVIEKEGHIDVLVNNAGAGFIGPVEDFSLEEVRKQFEINVFGTFSMMKAVLPHMRERNSGKIINLSSMAARSTTALYGLYSGTKMALEGISEALNLEVSHWNISVSLIEPGSFATNFGKNMTYPEAVKNNTPYTQLLAHYQNVRKTLDSKNNVLDMFRDPRRVAKLILRIANTRKPRLRYTIGPDSASILLSVKLLPYSVRKMILRRVYNW